MTVYFLIAVPILARHTEIPDLLVKKIRRQLDIPAPDKGTKGAK